MRLAGTWKQYWANAISQLTTTTSGKGSISESQMTVPCDRHERIRSYQQNGREHQFSPASLEASDRLACCHRDSISSGGSEPRFFPSFAVRRSTSVNLATNLSQLRRSTSSAL